MHRLAKARAAIRMRGTMLPFRCALLAAPRHPRDDYPCWKNETAQDRAVRTMREPGGADIGQAKVRSKETCGKAVPEKRFPVKT